MFFIIFLHFGFIDGIMIRYLARYKFSLLLIVAIWVVCLIPVPETPLDDISFIDKWTHFIMYGGLSFVLWVESALKHRDDVSVDWLRLVVCAFLLPAVMGGLVELAQAYLTTCRSGDWLDALCNALGALMGSLVGGVILYFLRRKK